MEKLDYVIDIQAFHDENGEFLPKEIAVVATETSIFSHWLIKSPYDCSKLPKPTLNTNSYLTCFYHGIEWFDGESNLEDVYEALKEVARHAWRIYVRGEKKQKLLERILGREIINLEEYTCPTFKTLPRLDEHFCFYHGKKKEYLSCALNHAYKLRRWLLQTVYARYAKEQQTKIQANRSEIDTLCGQVQNLNIVQQQQQQPQQLQQQQQYQQQQFQQHQQQQQVTPPTKIPKKKRKTQDLSSTYHLYDTVDNKLSTSPTSSPTHTGTDSRRLSSRQDTGSVGETLCPCS